MMMTAMGMMVTATLSSSWFQNDLRQGRGSEERKEEAVQQTDFH